jgi:PAS domain S-box-containing protein
MPEKDNQTHPWFVERRYLALIIVLVFFILSTTVFYICYRHHTISTEQALKEDRSTANLLSVILDQHLKKIVSIMESYSNRRSLLQAVRDKNVEKAQVHLINLTKSNPGIDILVISDRQGTLWAAYPERPELLGKNFAYRDWYKGVSKEWKPNITDAVMRIVREKDLAVTISVPFFDQTGEVIGILANAQRTVGLCDLIKQVPLDPGTSITVTDRKGQMIYSSRYVFEKEIRPYPFYPGIKKAMAANNKTFAVDDPDLGGRTRYISFAPAVNIGWTVFVGRDKHSILLSASSYYIQMTAIAFLLFLSIILFLFYSRKQVMAQQILEQLQAEKKIRAGEERYKSYIDVTMQLGWTTNDKGEIVEDNPSFTKYTGRGYEEIKGFGWIEDIHPDDRDHTEQIWRKAVADKSFYETEYRLRRYDGVYRDYLARGIPLLAENGSVREWIGTCIDITERKQAEAERERLTAAIEQAGEIVLITDPEGTIQYVNPAFETVTGYTQKEVLGQNPRMLKSGKQDEAFYRDLWETISAGRTWQGRMVNKRKDGKLYTEDATISPVCDPSGRIVNYVAVKHDITEHLRLAGQFQQAQKMEAVGRLTGGIAHDFNNLLTIIIGNADMAIGDVGKESPLYEFLEDIKGAGERAAGLIRQLLAFSRKQILQPEVVNLNEVVGEIDKMLRRVIGEDIYLKTVLAPDLGRVEADIGQLEQVIMNLAVNARDAMPGGGKLTIETANVELDEEYARNHVAVVPGPYVMLGVSDTGIGMSPEVQAQVFEPFFTTKEKDTGTGLGLSTVYGIVKQSRGNIWVYSEVGRGTSFKIYLPRVDKTGGGEKGKGVRSEVRGGSETVLVVEDEEMVRNIAVEILRRYGYRVLAAGDGQEAMEISEGHEGPIHLLLTDVVMPGMSGRDLAKILKGLHPEIKMLYMSGYTDNAIVHHAILDKGIVFIQKPFTPVDLARKVREVLDQD